MRCHCCNWRDSTVNPWTGCSSPVSCWAGPWASAGPALVARNHRHRDPRRRAAAVRIRCLIRAGTQSAPRRRARQPLTGTRPLVGGNAPRRRMCRGSGARTAVPPPGLRGVVTRVGDSPWPAPRGERLLRRPPGERRGGSERYDRSIVSWRSTHPGQWTREAICSVQADTPWQGCDSAELLSAA